MIERGPWFFYRYYTQPRGQSIPDATQRIWRAKGRGIAMDFTATMAGGNGKRFGTVKTATGSGSVGVQVRASCEGRTLTVSARRISGVNLVRLEMKTPNGNRNESELLFEGTMKELEERLTSWTNGRVTLTAARALRRTREAELAERVLATVEMGRGIQPRRSEDGVDDPGIPPSGGSHILGGKK